VTFPFTRGGAPVGALLRAALSAGILLAGVTACTSSPEASAGADSSAQVQPVVPTPGRPAPTRTPQQLLAPVPAAGTVVIEPGPFTDRLEFADLSLQPGERPVVTAGLSNAVDVSELIVLELRADFYDARGGYLGFGTADYADKEYADSGATPLTHDIGEHGDSFTVAVVSSTPLTGATSAILTVPQLVNE